MNCCDEHSWCEDWIDVDPERSVCIVYCVVCGFTLPFLTGNPGSPVRPLRPFGSLKM